MAEEKDDHVVADERRVGLWGASQSGKTTFISALFLATGRLASNDVRIRGNNGVSTDFLIRNTYTLNQKRRFPDPTIARQRLSWTIQMLVPNRAPRRFLRSAPGRVPFDFKVDVQDVGGFEHRPPLPEKDKDRLDIGGGGDGDGGEAPGAGIAAYFATCQGLLLLIDPINELKTGDAYNFFFGTLLRLAEEQPVPAGERLPHYVAVCVTKFDDPAVYEFGRDHGLISYHDDDPAMQPRVHPDETEAFIAELFGGMPKSDVDLLVNQLQQYFHADRIKFFVSSAVGFYIGPHGMFDVRDYKNVSMDEHGKPIIRGQIRPINVVEPLLWLGERIAAESRP
ncbi:MAG: hypothetical protein ACRDP5_08690 [Streptosporangiaceae bacterium]